MTPPPRTPWSLYDELIDAVPSGPRVRRAEIHGSWALVEADDGAVGVTSQYRGETRPREHDGDLVGMPLRDAAALIRSWNLVEAAIGGAALCAWTNTPERAAAAGVDDPTLAGPDTAFGCRIADLAGKRVAVVGHFRGIEEALGDVCELSVLERAPRDGDYPDTAAEYLLPESDVVLMTAATLANKAMPRLLELAAGARTVVLGPSTPLSPILLDRGVDCLSGTVMEDPAGIIAGLERGGKGKFRSGRHVNLVPAP
ncbi:DUF364 domain-containing protein [Actinomyces radicidentis]|uniref:DUF364 domain-containing protein n=1 Tax=Actinomyces radicidentis TaxID=111015 RepID=UPI0028EF270A|nr:DUF364 domain-containing protein [Actinomyces radicidentis]